MVEIIKRKGKGYCRLSKGDKKSLRKLNIKVPRKTFVTPRKYMDLLNKVTKRKRR